MIVYTFADGSAVPAGAFEHDGVAYPPNWLALSSDADLSSAGIIRTTVADPIPVPFVPQVISDRQFFQQLAVQAVITQDDALAAVKTGTLPASLVALVNGLPVEQQFGANMLLCGATAFDRQHPMVAVLGQAFGWTDAQLDTLWTAAFAL